VRAQHHRRLLGRRRALGLAAVADELNLTVTLLGTPSEEGGGGKIDLIEGGLLRRRARGDDGSPRGRASASTGHLPRRRSLRRPSPARRPTPRPHRGRGSTRSTRWTISQVAIGLLRQQLRPGDQFHGIVTEGGSAANIIPSRVVGRYMARSINDGETSGANCARTRRTPASRPGRWRPARPLEMVELGHQFSHMESDPDILASLPTRRRGARAHASTLDDEEAMPGPTISTDMANVSLVVPSIHPLLMIPTNGAVNHQPEFTAACITPDADQAVHRRGAWPSPTPPSPSPKTSAARTI
jgi:metal-dependent amidase/aminoacylase/carboxypeptidase family protein